MALYPGLAGFSGPDNGPEFFQPRLIWISTDTLIGGLTDMLNRRAPDLQSIGRAVL